MVACSALSEPCKFESREERSRYPVYRMLDHVSLLHLFFCLFLFSLSVPPLSREGRGEEDEKWREEGTTCPLAFSWKLLGSIARGDFFSHSVHFCLRSRLAFLHAYPFTFPRIYLRCLSTVMMLHVPRNLFLGHVALLTAEANLPKAQSSNESKRTSKKRIESRLNLRASLSNVETGRAVLSCSLKSILATTS